MYEYTNPEYYSKVNDYGDDYHKPEEEVKKNELELEVRKLKRRYRSFDEWCDAINAYNNYMENLISKYGGKKKFKLYYAIGLVKEYIPKYKPELRHTKNNRPYIKEGKPREQYKTEAFMLPVPIEYKTFKPVRSIDIIKRKGKSKIDQAIVDTYFKNRSMTERLTEELDIINNFYRNRDVKSVHLSHKQQRKRMLRERYHHKKVAKSFSQRLADYEDKKARGIYVEDQEDPTRIVYYKDTSFTAEERDEIEFLDLMESVGIHMKGRVSRKARKIIRRSKKSDKKKNKKKKKSSFMKKFAEGKYSTFADFQQEMLSLNSPYSLE